MVVLDPCCQMSCSPGFNLGILRNHCGRTGRESSAATWHELSNPGQRTQAKVTSSLFVPRGGSNLSSTSLQSSTNTNGRSRRLRASILASPHHH
ncbi:hypothetical protein MTO96_024762 [Rhipicephalus appendiculatus]